MFTEPLLGKVIASNTGKTNSVKDFPKWYILFNYLTATKVTKWIQHELFVYFYYGYRE